MAKPMEPGHAHSSAPNFDPNRPSVDPKWDVLQRDGADYSGYELEHPVQISSRGDDIVQVIRQLVIASLISLAVTIFVVWPLNRFLGGSLSSPQSIPVWILLSVFLGAWAIIARAPWWMVVVGGLAGPVTSLYFGFVYSSTRQGNLGARLLLSTLVAAMTGVLADCISTHMLHRLTAGDRVLRSVRDRRRAWWSGRFDSGQLWLMKEELVQAAKEESSAGNIPLAQAYLGQATELASMLSYEKGFAILFLYVVLALIPNSFFLIVFIPPAVVLFVRAHTDTAMVLDTAWEALLSWFSYGRFGTDAPGVFQSPITSCAGRGAFAVAGMFLIATIFTPPLPAFYGGVLFTTSWYWGLLLKLLGSLVLPMLVVITVLVSTSGQILAQVRRAVEVGGMDEALSAGKTNWEIFVEKIRWSSHPVEKTLIWLGLHSFSKYPVLLDTAHTAAHVHILGDTGSGKSALGLNPLIQQIIERGDGSVVILDFKGGMDTMQQARISAAKTKRKFKQFTNVVGLRTHVFNAFSQVLGQPFSVNQICEIFLQALRLEHGEGYGRSFYSRKVRSYLTQILSSHPGIASFEELKRFTAVEFFANLKDREDCFELISVIEILAAMPQLNFGKVLTDSVKREAIHMPTVLKEKQVVYFWLPAAIESATVREVGNLAIYTLFATMASLGNQHRCTLIIDEFQRIAGEGFILILEQARSMGLSVILANQTLSDLLLTESPSLQNVVTANTRVKITYAATDPAVQDLMMKSSGETLYVNSYSGIYAGMDDVELERQSIQIGPRLMRNDIIKLSAEPNTCIVHITRDVARGSRYGGLCFPVTSEFHITEEEYRRRLRAPWPDAHEGTIIAPAASATRPNTSQSTASSAGAAPNAGPPPAGPQAPPVAPKPQKTRSKEGELWARRLRKIQQVRTKLH